MATTYAAVYVFDAQVQEEAVDKIQQRIENMITGSSGTLLDSQRWGKRKLSYLIRRKTHGLYHYLLFASDNAELPQLLEQEFNPKRIDTILRSLIVRLDPGEIPTVEPREKEDTDTSAAKDPASAATETPPAEVTAADSGETSPAPGVAAAGEPQSTEPTE